MQDKQFAVIARLLLGSFALVSLFLPWATVMSVNIAGVDLRWSPLLMMGLIAALGLSVYGLLQARYLAFTISTLAVWTVALATCIGYTFYILGFAKFACLGLGIPLLAVTALAMIILDWPCLPVDNRSLSVVIGVAVVLAGFGMGAARGHAVGRDSGIGKVGPDAKEEFQTAMRRAFGGMSTPGSGEQSTDRKVEITSSQWTESYQVSAGVLGAYKPDPGKRYVIMTVTVRNAGKENCYISADDFKMTCDNKNIYSSLSLISAEGIDFISAELMPGGSATGQVVFDVDANAQPVSIEYHPLF